MENKETITTKPEGVCEKLFTALSLRSISHDSQSHIPPKALTAPTNLPHENPEAVKLPQSIGMPEKRKMAEVVPVKVDLMPLLPPLPTKEKAKPTTRLIPVEGKSQEDSFNAKLDQAPLHASGHVYEKPKKNMVGSAAPTKAVVRHGMENVASKVEVQRAASAKGEGGKMRGFSNINEKASDYIARAKIKIMSTTSFNSGRVTSFKRRN